MPDGGVVPFDDVGTGSLRDAGTDGGGPDARVGCEGVVCDRPPTSCFRELGVCEVDGVCRYSPTDGNPCNDGDPDTSVDRCSAGNCVGRGLVRQSRLSSGSGFSCAIRASGDVACWGQNHVGQLGVPGSANHSIAVVVPSVEGAVEIASGGDHSCARTTSGNVWCWGSNDFGEVGTGTSSLSEPPTLVSGLTDAVELAMGTDHACARRASGEVLCWGGNDVGQVGDGTTFNRSAPLLIPDISPAIAIGAGFANSCASVVGGQVRCWGDNRFGAVGDGTRDRRLVPTLVPDLTGVVEIAGGTFFNCARLSTGEVKCWGDNQADSLGIGVGGSMNALSPVLAYMTGVTSISAGDNSVCVVSSDGLVSCWGDYRPTALVVGLSDIREVRVGDIHACAMRNDGAVLCWGRNFYGQLGDGSTTTRETPAEVMWP